MSQEHETTDSLPDEGKQALTALRNIWSARQQTSADIEESCSNTKSCKNMENVGFHGMIEGDDTPTKGNTSVDSSLRAAWRNKLERDGKLNPSSGSIRDIVFGSSEPKNK